MKRIFSSVAAVLLLIPAALLADSPQKPNILLIYSDDHGWADLGQQGVDSDVRTPNFDQMARDGVRFVRGYVSAPQCFPSRAGVLSGRYQQRFGVDDNNSGPFPLSEITLAKRLKPAGYVSGFVGKSHLDIAGKDGKEGHGGILLDHLPNHLGFDEYFAGTIAHYHASHGLDSKPFADAPHAVLDKRFRVVVQTEAALSFLDRRKSQPQQPWFLYLAWFAPHVPLESAEPWFSKTPNNLPLERRQALSMIAAMDEGLGQLRAKLREMGVEKNTLIFLISDNGAPLKTGAWNGSLNKPLIGEKGMLTDGGIRTPFIAVWPGTIPPGQNYDHPVINLDVAATANALAGLPQDSKLDGVNLMPFLKGEVKEAPHERLFWRWRSQAAVLEYPWKLIDLGDHEKFLFNVTNPDGELAVNNQLSQHPDIAARLETQLQAWSAGLQPAGPPKPSNAEDDKFYSAHVTKTAEMAPKSNGKDGTTTGSGATTGAAEGKSGTQGWEGRSCTLQVKDGALVVAHEAASKGAFLTRTKFDVSGPMTLTLRARAAKGGRATVSWRNKGDADFVATQVVSFEWPTGEEMQEVKVELPVHGRLIHLRIGLGESSAETQIESITLRGREGNPEEFHFDTPAH